MKRPIEAFLRECINESKNIHSFRSINVGNALHKKLDFAFLGFKSLTWSVILGHTLFFEVGYLSSSFGPLFFSRR